MEIEGSGLPGSTGALAAAMLVDDDSAKSLCAFGNPNSVLHWENQLP